MERLPAALSLLTVACAPTPDGLVERPGERTTEADSGWVAPATEPVRCAEPDLRAALGPLEAVDLGDFVPASSADPATTPAIAGAGVAVADIDGDGRPDLLLPNPGADRLLLQDEDGGFHDATAERWPVDPAARSAAINTVDLDGDGDEDVYVCHEDGPNALYLNDGAGTLVDASAAWGVDTHDRTCINAAFGDIDGDGDLDLALANNDPCPVTPEGEDCSAIEALPSAKVLYENVGGRFVDISDRLEQDALRASMMAVISLVDLDGDGDLDIYITNDDRMDLPLATHNLAYFNDGAGGFTRGAEDSGLHVSLEGMGAGFGDLNGDGRVDMLITGFRDVALLLSSPTVWFDADRSRGMVPVEESRWFAWGAELADLDNDGDLDAPVAFGWLPPTEEAENPLVQRDALWRNDGEDAGFVEVAGAWGWADPGFARGVAVVDLDGDGWLDLLKRELGGPLRLHRARCGHASWLTVRLQQPGENRDAVGAEVRLEAGGATMRRWVWRGGTSYAVSVPPRLHFGLGEVSRVERLVVVWPDGTEQDFGAAAPMQHLTLVRQ